MKLNIDTVKVFEQLNYDDCTVSRCLELNNGYYLNLDTNEICHHTNKSININASDCFQTVKNEWAYSHSEFEQRKQAVMENNGFASRELGYETVTVEHKHYVNQFGDVRTLCAGSIQDLKDNWEEIATQLIAKKAKPVKPAPVKLAQKPVKKAVNPVPRFITGQKNVTIQEFISWCCKNNKKFPMSLHKLNKKSRWEASYIFYNQGFLDVKDVMTKTGFLIC